MEDIVDIFRNMQILGHTDKVNTMWNGIDPFQNGVSRKVS